MRISRKWVLRFSFDDGIVVVGEKGGGSVRGYSERKVRKRREGIMTTEEYLMTEETVLPRELAYGVLHVAESPSAHHQRMVGRLFLAMAPFAQERRLGEVLLAPMDIVLDYDRALVVQPDLLFVSNARSRIVTDRVFGAPDVVVEVLSPHPRVGELDERVGWFAKYGVRECWIADRAKQQYSILLLDRTGVAERRVAGGWQPAPSDVLPGVVLPSFHG